MPSANEINGFHRSLASELSGPDLLGTDVTIRDPAPNWTRRRRGGTVGFHLWVHESHEQAICDRGRQWVAALSSPSPHVGRDGAEAQDAQAWASWYDEWTRVPGQRFDLLAAKWTVFWGHAGEPRKTQILRAEWDQRQFVESGASDAAQPHWHVDPLLILAGSAPPPLTELVELPSPRHEARLAMGRVHLAMGGWENQPRSEAEDAGGAAVAWQRRFSGDVDDLREWAVLTLRYLKLQCRWLRPEAATA